MGEVHPPPSIFGESFFRWLDFDTAPDMLVEFEPGQKRFNNQGLRS